MSTESKTNDSGNISVAINTGIISPTISQNHSVDNILTSGEEGKKEIDSEVIQNIDPSHSVPATETANVNNSEEMNIVDQNTDGNVSDNNLSTVEVNDCQNPNKSNTQQDETTKTNKEKKSFHDSSEKIPGDKEQESTAVATIEKVTELTEEIHQDKIMSKDDEDEQNNKLEEVAVAEKSVTNQKHNVTFETSDEDDKASSRLQPLPENAVKKFETVFPAPQHQSNTLTVTSKRVVENASLPYKFVYDPNKISIKFLFANRDGLFVSCDCAPSDTIGEVKGVLMSMWPEELPTCSGGDQIRLICMGKGLLMPDTRSLKDCDVPVFKTHPTPVNVSLKPAPMLGSGDALKKNSYAHNSGNSSERQTTESVGTTCSCVIL